MVEANLHAKIKALVSFSDIKAHNSKYFISKDDGSGNIYFDSEFAEKDYIELDMELV